MTLRIRLILLTTAVVVVLFGISEWLSFEYTASLLDKHEAILRETADHTVALERLQATRDRMFVSVTSMRILHAAGTLLIAVAALNYLWYRVIYRPIQRLLAQINSMSRGTWQTAAIPVKRNDEIGQLTSAFNDLGGQLALSFRYVRTSAKLAALALIGGRISRRIAAVRSDLAASAQVLRRRPSRGARAGAEVLTAADLELAELEAQIEKAFDDELAAASAAAPERTEERVS